MQQGQQSEVKARFQSWWRQLEELNWARSVLIAVWSCLPVTSTVPLTVLFGCSQSWILCHIRCCHSSQLQPLPWYLILFQVQCIIERYSTTTNPSTSNKEISTHQTFQYDVQVQHYWCCHTPELNPVFTALHSLQALNYSWGDKMRVRWFCMGIVSGGRWIHGSLSCKVDSVPKQLGPLQGLMPGAWLRATFQGTAERTAGIDS